MMSEPTEQFNDALGRIMFLSLPVYMRGPVDAIRKAFDAVADEAAMFREMAEAAGFIYDDEQECWHNPEARAEAAERSDDEHAN